MIEKSNEKFKRRHGEIERAFDPGDPMDRGIAPPIDDDKVPSWQPVDPVPDDDYSPDRGE